MVFILNAQCTMHNAQFTMHNWLEGRIIHNAKCMMAPVTVKLGWMND